MSFRNQDDEEEEQKSQEKKRGSLETKKNEIRKIRKRILRKIIQIKWN